MHSVVYLYIYAQHGKVANLSRLHSVGKVQFKNAGVTSGPVKAQCYVKGGK